MIDISSDSQLVTDKQRRALLGDWDILTASERRDFRDRTVANLVDLATLQLTPPEERKKMFKKAIEGEIRKSPPPAPVTVDDLDNIGFEIEKFPDEISGELSVKIIQSLSSVSPAATYLYKKDERNTLFRDINRYGDEFLALLETGLDFIFHGLVDQEIEKDRLEALLERSLTTAANDPECVWTDDCYQLVNVSVTIDLEPAEEQLPAFEDLAAGEEITSADVSEFLLWAIDQSGLYPMISGIKSTLNSELGWSLTDFETYCYLHYANRTDHDIFEDKDGLEESIKKAADETIQDIEPVIEQANESENEEYGERAAQFHAMFKRHRGSRLEQDSDE